VNQRVSQRLISLAERLRRFTPTARIVDAKADEGQRDDSKSSGKDA